MQKSPLRSYFTVSPLKQSCLPPCRGSRCHQPDTAGFSAVAAYDVIRRQQLINVSGSFSAPAQLIKPASAGIRAASSVTVLLGFRCSPAQTDATRRSKQWLQI